MTRPAAPASASASASATASSPAPMLAGPMLAAIAGIALFSAMDALMKGASLAVGAYSALWLRSVIGCALTLPAWLVRARRRPPALVLRLHALRGTVNAFMALAFFFALTRLPLAEAIALSFIAPLIALFLAAGILGERIGTRAIVAALVGLAGIIVIAAGRIGAAAVEGRAVAGIAALLASALLFAWNLILQRQQARLAPPLEVAAAHNLVILLVLGLAAPVVLILPGKAIWAAIAGGAVLSVASVMLMSWAYARAQAQVLVPFEYTAFIWAALLGWAVFAEPITIWVLAGTALIVAGCAISAKVEQG